MGDKHPRAVFGRIMVCRVCGERVDVIELPARWLDKDRYTCGRCLVPVETPRRT